MSDAPERIWAWHSMKENDLLSGMWRNWDAPVASDAVTYIRADHVDALLKAEREKALREAVDIAHDHKGFRPAAAWSDDECQGYQNGQIDIQSAISDALRALAEKEATP